MHSWFIVPLVIGLSAWAPSVPISQARGAVPIQPTDERAGFVTVLGRDTVAVESFTRTAARIDGYIVVRVPGTVLCHYTADLGSDGVVTRTNLEILPLGTSQVTPRQIALVFAGDSVRVTMDSSGHKQTATRAVTKGEFPLLMTGFGASYGLYSSLGMYELLLSRARIGVGDTLTVPSIDMQSAQSSSRRFVRRSPTVVDADWFGVLWTQLTVDSLGRILSEDASHTTEKTETRRTEFIDARGAARAFAAADQAGKGIGVASPNQVAKATIGGQLVVATYGSPRKRGRVILGNVIPYDKIWRAGANEATVLILDRSLSIAGTVVPTGAYSLWTIPKPDGTVQLIVNRQHGQWGTDYDPAQDLVRLPMHVTSAPAPRENFAIELIGSGNTGELRMGWDTFVWSVPLAAK